MDTLGSLKSNITQELLALFEYQFDGCPKLAIVSTELFSVLDAVITTDPWVWTFPPHFCAR
jgi:hypothetical protein